MNNRSLLGWLLVGAFSASVSCGSNGGGGAPQGFGLACMSDKECKGYDLLCSPTDDRCVQCLAESDCTSAENCMSGLCKTPQRCEDSRDCSSNLVCNETAGVCVQCLESTDCNNGEKCVSQQCVDRQVCEFTSDCEDGLLCDVDAGICVACRNDNDCPSRRVCEDNECVVPDPGGGEGGEGASSGTPNGGSSSGTPNGGTGGRAGGGGGGSGGGGSGGTPPTGCDCNANQACTPSDERCVPLGLVDDLLDCDDEILEIEGRSGPWYATADLDIDIDVGYNSPNNSGSAWVDTSCGAWLVGGAVENGVDTTFAVLAAILNQGDPYDLSGYTGVQVVLESDNAVQVVVKTLDGHYQHTLPYLQAGSNLRSVPFNMLVAEDTLVALDLTAVTEIQFTPVDTTSFGYAVHKVELYGAL